MSKEARRVRLSAAPANGVIHNINVDRQNEIVRGACVMMADTEAIGHGVMSDEKTIEAVAALGNQRTQGVIGRLGHPGISENATARQIVAARNFRIADGKLLADLHALPAAHTSPAFGNDPITWLLDIAEQNPEHVALSVVIEADSVWKLKSGEEIDAGWGEVERPERATHELPILRPVSLWAVDVVNEGALTRGMFSANEPSFYAAGVYEFLDEWRAQFNIPLADIRRKANQLTESYLQSRGYSEKGTTMPKKRQFNADGTPEATPPVDDHEVDTQPLDDDDPTLDPLAEAEAAVNATAQQLDDAEAESEEQEEAPATNAEFAALREENALLLSRVDRLERLLALNIKNVARLAGDVSRIDGEPVANGKVGKSTAFGARGGSPVPPASLTRQAPGSITSRQLSVTDQDFEANTEAATFAAQVARAAQFNK